MKRCAKCEARYGDDLDGCPVCAKRDEIEKLTRMGPGWYALAILSLLLLMSGFTGFYAAIPFGVLGVIVCAAVVFSRLSTTVKLTRELAALEATYSKA